MSKMIHLSRVMLLGSLLFLIACNNEEKTEESTSTDSTKNETTQPTTETLPNAVTAAPQFYKLLADSLGIRIVDATYKPGDSSVMHSHKDYVVYIAEGGTATFYSKDGSKMDNVMPAGASMVRGTEAHSVKNTGKTAFTAILFEVDRPAQTSTPDAAMDATKVAPDVYKLVKDTLGIRLIEVSAKPGQTVAQHSHPDGALYVTQGSTAEFTGKDGTKRVVEMKKGMAVIIPADTHSVKNTGKTTMKAILVEVWR